MEDLFTFSGGFSLDLVFNIFLYFILGLLVWQSSVLRSVRQKKDDLEKKTAYLGSLIDHSEASWIIWNLEDETFIISGGMQSITGSDSEEALSMSEAVLLFGEESRDTLTELFAQFRASQRSYNERVDSSSKGRKFELSLRPLDGVTAVIWVTDITSEIIDQANANKRIASLLEERQRYRAILDALPYPIWYRTADGNLTFHNAAYGEMDDMSHVGGESAREKSLWSEFDIMPSRVESVTVPGRMVNRRHVVVDGRRALLEMHEVNVDNERVGFATELTQLEEGKKELIRHRQAHRQVLENLSIGITIYGPDKRLVFFNHAYSRMFEFDESFLHACPSLGEVLENLRSRELVQESMNFPEYKKRLYQQFTALISPLQELTYLPDGRTLRVITAPHPLGGLFYVFEDVTNSLELEQKYNTQIAVQKETLNALHEGVAVFGCDHKLQIINEEFLSINSIDDEYLKSGMTLSEAMDVNKNQIILSESWKDYKERVLRAVNERTPRSVTLDMKTGKTLNFRYLPLINGAHLFSVIDITDRLRVEKVLKDHNNALVVNNRIKTEFIENICYLFERPLRRLQGYGEILMKTLANAPETSLEPITHIRATAQRLNSLVSDLRGLSDDDLENSPPVPRKVDLGIFVRDFLLSIHDVFVTHNLEIFSDLQKKPIIVSLDETRLRQAFLHLFTTIIQQIPPKSVLQFTTKSIKNRGVLVVRFPSNERLRKIFMMPVSDEFATDQDFSHRERPYFHLLYKTIRWAGGDIVVSGLMPEDQQIILSLTLS
ncbi:MAG: PAS-domain containing protein [Alphaproteobacteria bacterium]|nr:MAG: PAS-domain containing protein [Alphaproteobacteria bacterium]